jgi:hypothetical protein
MERHGTYIEALLQFFKLGSFPRGQAIQSLFFEPDGGLEAFGGWEEVEDGIETL